MTEGQINEALASASPELQHQWFQHKVPKDVQTALVKDGFEDVGIFANIGYRKLDARTSVTKDLGLKADLALS